MNWIGIVPVLIGAVYLIYSVLFRDRVTYYNRIRARKIEMTIIKPGEFLKLQLDFSIFNSIYCIVYGGLIIIFNINSIFIVVGLGIFHLINFLLIAESKKKGYVYYK